MTQQHSQAIRLAIVGLAVVAAGWLVLVEPFILPDGLPNDMPVSAPQRCIGVFLICMSLWVTNLIPLAATGLLALALLPLLHVLPEDRALALFGNRAVFFMLGVFLLAGAMISTGLSKRVTLLALQHFDKSPQRMITGVTLSATFLAMLMPGHAVAAMIYPILVEVCDSLGLKKGNPFARKLFLGLAWGATIGGVGTFLGGARAPLALSLLQKTYPGKTISFIQWVIAAAPVVILMATVAVVALGFRGTTGVENIKAARVMLDERVNVLGPMSPQERRLTALSVLTILAWIVLGSSVGLAVIAILSAVLLFLLRIAEWNAVQPYVNWGVLLMYGGAVALGAALTETHAMSWLAARVIGPDAPKLLILMVMVALTIALTEGISNAAAVAIMLPIGYSLGDMTGIGPVMMTLAVTVTAGLAFLLPVSSPPNAISFTAGHYSVRDVVRLGWPLTAAAFVVLFLVIVVWWGPILNVSSW